MKTPFLVALAGLAIGFAVPTLAQQTVDPQVREQIDAKIKKSDEAFNNNDAAALAALLTEDAIVVTERGPVFGREPMERYWETERVKNFECVWGHWTAWIVPGFECAQVFAQRCGNRDQETLASLADGERDLLASQIDLCPGQCG